MKFLCVKQPSTTEMELLEPLQRRRGGTVIALGGGFAAPQSITIPSLEMGKGKIQGSFFSFLFPEGLGGTADQAQPEATKVPIQRLLMVT